jgi:hypothetical protein
MYIGGMQTTPRPIYDPSRMLEPPGTSRTPSRADPLHRVRGLVQKRLAFGIHRHVDDLPHPKPQQQPFLDPRVDPPACPFGRTRLGGAHPSFVQRVLEIGEQLKIGAAV